MREKSKELLRDTAHYPRSEYRTRFADTSAFPMEEAEFWDSYFRSTNRGGDSDRISGHFGKSKTFENEEINSFKERAAHVKTGSFRSPFIIPQYAEIVQPGDGKRIEAQESIYGKILKYKTGFCKKVQKDFLAKKQKDSSSLKNVSLFYGNKYPCIIIRVSGIIKAEECNMIRAYFVAFADDIARKKKIPIEIVLRSSFGHNIPSASVAGSSLRINVGLVPKIYADVLLDALCELSGFVEYLKTVKVQEDFCSSFNQKMRKYKAELPEITSTDTLWDVLRKKGDSKGGSLLKQLLRKNKYSDLLADIVLEGLNSEEIINHLHIPLIKMLEALSFEDGVRLQYDTLRDSLRALKGKLEFDSNVTETIEKDVLFWGILGKVASRLNLVPLTYNVSQRSILKLYKNLEEANDHFICSSGAMEAEDGPGSESEAEIDNVSVGKIYAKKITLVTGMRAINIAAVVASYYLRKAGLVGVPIVGSMYYETKTLISYSQPDFEFYGIDMAEEEEDAQESYIYYFDLTHCNTKNTTEEEHFKIPAGCRVIVLDYTSATPERILEYVEKAFSTSTAEVVLLLESGLKNAKCGADINPYGTVRILSKEQSTTLELYTLLKRIVKSFEYLPKPAHQIRKAYKQKGFALAIRDIFAPQNVRRWEKILQDSQDIDTSRELQWVHTILQELEFSEDWISDNKEEIKKYRSDIIMHFKSLSILGSAAFDNSLEFIQMVVLAETISALGSKSKDVIEKLIKRFGVEFFVCYPDSTNAYRLVIDHYELLNKQTQHLKTADNLGELMALLIDRDENPDLMEAMFHHSDLVRYISNLKNLRHALDHCLLYLDEYEADPEKAVSNFVQYLDVIEMLKKFRYSDDYIECDKRDLPQNVQEVHGGLKYMIASRIKPRHTEGDLFPIGQTAELAITLNALSSKSENVIKNLIKRFGVEFFVCYPDSTNAYRLVIDHYELLNKQTQYLKTADNLGELMALLIDRDENPDLMEAMFHHSDLVRYISNLKNLRHALDHCLLYLDEYEADPEKAVSNFVQRLYSKGTSPESVLKLYSSTTIPSQSTGAQISNLEPDTHAHRIRQPKRREDHMEID